jgi:serine/threonine protein kinase/Tol biopolymer transport system component
MTSEQWKRVARIHEAALACPPQERPALVAEMSSGDPALQREVESLLAQDSRPSVLDRTLEATAADLLPPADRLVPGSRLGSYRIEALIGVGGMGEVYRARDERLRRTVALKVLPAAFAAHGERAARFEREAHVLASLNHPHIATIHGLEESDGVQALVLEFVDGPTLADRLVRGPLPLDEALPIARQIAEALEAAHDQGVVHRDLKPANIKLTSSGVVKVLDFGLARLVQDDAAASYAGATASPTLTTPAMTTAAGVVLGTAAYMSPEQAKGRPADKRSDIWAFGAVFYEMLTGTRAFAGDDMADTLANVLKTEPDFAALPSDTPASIRRLLRRCFVKDRKKRLADASSLQLEIDDAAEADAIAAESVTKSPRRAIVASAAVAAIAAALVVAAGVWVLRSRPDGREMRLEISTPPTTDLTAMAISPDGRAIAFVAGMADRRQLWIRSFDSAAARPLDGTEGASTPFWAPDSHAVAFVADQKLKVADIVGHSVRTIADRLTTPLGGAWNRGDVILLGGGVGPLLRMTPDRAAPGPATALLPGQRNHSHPSFLPDARHFLYYAEGRPDVRGVWVGALDGTPPRRLLDADAAAVYARGQLLFVRQGTLLAQPFDPERLVLNGNPATIAEQVASDNQWAAAVAASADGPVTYRTQPASVRQQFAWFDRSGRQLATVGEPDPTYGAPSLSRDSRRLAFNRRVDGNSDVWILDLERGLATRVTRDPLLDGHPLWSPDGNQIVFQRFVSARGDLHLTSLADMSNDVTLLADGYGNIPTDWSADGRFILYKRSAGVTASGWDIYALPMQGDRKPFPVVATEFDEQNAQFSPDGKWIAYESEESGRFEIYAQPFPGPGPREQISTAGGAQVRWRPDGREVFYLALDGRLMGVPIRPDPEGRTLRPGTPVPLFKPSIGDVVQRISRQHYAVAANGDRFLVDTVAGQDAASPIQVILNLKP